MDKYEFSLRQEVLREKGASVIGELFRLEDKNQIADDVSHPVNILHDLVWDAKQDIISARTYGELDKIEGQFDLAIGFIKTLESALAGASENCAYA